MKNFKTLLFVLLLTVVSANFAVAQQNVDVNATVLTDFTVTNPTALSFGNISSDISTNTPTVDPTDGGGDANVQGTVTVGQVLVDAGTPGASVVISWNTNAQLAGPDGGTTTIDYTPELWGETGDNTATARAPTASASELTTSGGSSATLDATNGDFTIWVGGTLSNPSATLTAGVYTSLTGTNANATDFAVTVSYF